MPILQIGHREIMLFNQGHSRVSDIFVGKLFFQWTRTAVKMAKCTHSSATTAGMSLVCSLPSFPSATTQAEVTATAFCAVTIFLTHVPWLYSSSGCLHTILWVIFKIHIDLIAPLHCSKTFRGSYRLQDKSNHFLSPASFPKASWTTSILPMCLGCLNTCGALPFCTWEAHLSQGNSNVTLSGAFLHLSTSASALTLYPSTCLSSHNYFTVPHQTGSPYRAEAISYPSWIPSPYGMLGI